MPTLAAVKAANASTKLSYARPIALFVGGTSGIGQGTVEAFARAVKGEVDIYICGRNKAAAEATLASLPTPKTTANQEAKYRRVFLPCDATRYENVRAACRQLQDEHGVRKLNYLFMSQGFFSMFGGTVDNGDGLDIRLVLHFYSRFWFVHELLPLLRAAKSGGEEARVASVLAAGKGLASDLTDVGSKKTTYSVAKLGFRTEAPAYNDVAVEAFARKYPEVSFTHLYPGLVDTNIFSNSWISKILAFLMKPLATSQEDCGECMTRALLDPAFEIGAHHLSEQADPIPRDKLHVSDEAQEAIFSHFMTSFPST